MSPMWPRSRSPWQSAHTAAVQIPYDHRPRADGASRMSSESQFEAGRLLGTPIANLGLTIEGTDLEPVLNEFRQELERAGIRRLKPHFYLSDEWGVPFETIAVGIPFYLARPDLIALQAERVGHLEGVGRADLLRYLRHEMGHVVNYAYRLYDQSDWVARFGAMSQPYLDEYHPEPFSRRFVRHLPGWYAQKHPDEDWAETFAVWLTPGQDWRADYAAFPDALAKLEYCDATMHTLVSRDPVVTAIERDDDVNQLFDSLGHHYDAEADDDVLLLPPGLDGALRAIFEDCGANEPVEGSVQLPAHALILLLEGELVANVFRWTGHFPDRTRRLLRHLAERARALNQVYTADHQIAAAVAITTLVTALAMNHVQRGSYLS